MKKVLAMFMVAVTLVLCVGCGNQSTAESSESVSSTNSVTSNSGVADTEEGVVPDSGTFVYIGRGLSDPFCALCAQAMQSAFLDKYPNWTFSIQDADNDASKLIEILENCITQGVDVIADGGVADSDATATVKEVIDADIFIYGVEIAPSEKEDIAPYVYVDFYNTYKVLMDWSLDQVPENANVVILSGIQGFAPCTAREKALDEFLEARPDVNVLDKQYANYNTDEAMNIMEDWLQMYDNIDAVLSLTDTMAIGAIEAYRAAGMDCTDVWICGVDALTDACGYIESGELTVSVFRSPQKYAEAGIDLIERYYAGEITDPGEAVLLNCEVIVTKDNVEEILAEQQY